MNLGYSGFSSGFASDYSSLSQVSDFRRLLVKRIKKKRE
jgi:hypothetical protein